MAARYSNLDSDIGIPSTDSEGEEELAGGVQGYLYTPSVPIDLAPAGNTGDSPAGTPQPP